MGARDRTRRDLANVVSNTDETEGMAGLPDLFNGMATAVQKYPGAIISMSFAAAESTFTVDDVKNSLQGALHKVFEDATANDVTLLAGAGDTGTDNQNVTETGFNSFADVNFPASDPLVTAVGGTALEADWRWNPQGTADDYWSCQLQGTKTCPKDFLASIEGTGTQVESLWKEDWAGAGGGGGVSTVFDEPDFQKGSSNEKNGEWPSHASGRRDERGHQWRRRGIRNSDGTERSES